MKNNNKKKNENKICCILHTVSSLLFMASGIGNFVYKGFTDWTGYTNVALGITFGCLAFLYYKKIKEEK